MRYLFFLLIIVAGTQVQSQKLEPTSPDYPDSLATGHSVVLDYEIHYEVTAPSAATISYRKVITLLNADHGRENVLRQYYSEDSKVTDFSAASYDRRGNQLFRARSGDITDRQAYTDSFYDNLRYQEITVPCNSYPCTVVSEVTYKVTDYDMMGFPHWQPQDYDQALVHSSFTATVPSDNELLYHGNLLPAPMLTDNGKTRTYRWEIGHRAARTMEPYAPPASATLPYLRIALADFEVEGYRGSFRDWKSFGKFMQDIMRDRDQLPLTLATKVRELVMGAATERERIDRLYRFMQDRMRYVSIQLGLGGWQPFSAEYVERNRFGDCKALSNYMGAMLKEVGIESYPVLINWSEHENYPVTESFTTSAFNHMVLYVPSEAMYLECTSNEAPTGYLGEDKQDRNVLWVTPEGGQLQHTPTQLPAENGHTRTVNLALTNEDATRIAIDATFYGGAQESFRWLAGNVPDRHDQLVALHRNEILPDVSGSGYRLTVKPDVAEANVHYVTEVNNYVRKMGSRLFVPLNNYYAQTWAPEPDDDRQLPVHTTTTRLLVDTVNLSLPPNMEVESGLFSEPITYTHPVGAYRAELRTTDHGLQWIRTLKLVPVDLPASAYPAYRQFFLDISKAERAQVVLRERRSK